MKVSVNGVEIRDMRSYLAKKKQEREQKGYKFRETENHQGPDPWGLPDHGDQHHETHFRRRSATGDKSKIDLKSKGISDANEGKKNIFKKFLESEK